MIFDSEALRLLEEPLAILQKSIASLPDTKPAAAADRQAMQAVLNDVATRLVDNYPFAHPLYAGQMLKPPHDMARLAYTLAMSINPNNHALDGGRASSIMEKEAVKALATLCGWGDDFLGHLTSGGTVANLEALWVGSKLRPGGVTLASAQAHYTHSRLTGVLSIPYATVSTDREGRMDLDVLATMLAEQDVATVVATLGTTGLGAVDPLPDIIQLARRHGARVHVDAAYGGYYQLAGNLGQAATAAFAALGEADSIVIDPHKHGLQPYGCGAILFREPSVAKFYAHDSAYTYFSSDELHLGEISLECSRAGAAAVALWATQQLLPMTRDGLFARQLEGSYRAAVGFYERLCDDDASLALLQPELDIVVWAPAADSFSQISKRSQAVFERAAENDLHLAVMTLDAALVSAHWPNVVADQASVTCLRSVLMKSDHEDWLDELWARYQQALLIT